MSEREPRRWSAPGLDRRTLLRGGILGGAGLAAAALIGCGGGDDDDDAPEATAAAPAASTPAATATAAGGADSGAAATPEAGRGKLVQDPDLPYPYQFPEPAGVTPKSGGVMRVAATFSISTMDPTASAAGGTITVPNMVYNKLLGHVGGVDKDPFTIELKPELASSWERSQDGAVFTFNIRDDVKWQNIAPLNGRGLTAHDIKFAFDRYATEGVHQSYWKNIGSIEAVDDYTLTMTMSKVTADFILPLGSRYQTIFPRELVDDGTISDKVIGTGSMILTEAEIGSHAHFVKNPDYWESEVLLDGFEFQLVGDYSARLAGFRVGQFDYCYGLVPNIRAMDALLETNPDVQVNFNTNVRGAPFGMNLDSPMFEDERVRQAITLAVDMDLMSDLLYDGLSKINALQAWTVPFDEEPTRESGLYGPWYGRWAEPGAKAEARKLLAAAGAEGLTFDNFYHNYGSPVGDQEAEITAKELEQVGVTMNQRHVDYTEFNSTWVTAKLEEGCTSCWATVGFDPDHYFHNLVHSGSGSNRWRLNDPQVDAWAEQQQSELDPEARREIHRTMWDYFLQRMYWPPAPSGFTFEVYQPWVRNLRFGGVSYSNGSYYDWGHQAAGAWLDK